MKENKTFLVLGASGGIGMACASRLAAQGHTVLAQGYRHTEEIRRKIPEGDVTAFSCDLASNLQITQMCRRILEVYHQVDGIVFSAGVAHSSLLTDLKEEEWQHLFDVNVTSLYRICRELLPGMVSRQSGSLVVISSMWGRVGASCEAAYSATKAALIGLTRALAKEVGPSGVRVNCIAPGVIDTAMMDCYSDEVKRELAEETPLGRLGRPEDIAGAVAFLLSEDASFITGQTLGIDGGFI